MTPEQKVILSEELTNDPTGKGYDVLLINQPGHVVDLLNAKSESKYGLLDKTNLTLWAVKTNMFAVIEDEANDKLSPLRSSAMAILYVLKGASSGVDFSKIENMQIIDLWKYHGKLSLEHSDLMLLMSTHPASRAEVLGLPHITEEILREL